MNEDTIRNWIQKAENDLKIGKDEMATQEPARDMVCFHMQQCSEKYLKTFLIFHDKEYPRSHNLEALLTLCLKIDQGFQDLVELGVQELTKYATSLRYGDKFYSPSLEETNQTIVLAEKVRDFVRDKLRQKGFKT
jgi:HEPN domain-containing protein